MIVVCEKEQLLRDTSILTERFATDETTRSLCTQMFSGKYAPHHVRFCFRMNVFPRFLFQQGKSNPFSKC